MERMDWTDRFGPGCTSWIRLDLWTRHRPYTELERKTLSVMNASWADNDDRLVVSDFRWTGGPLPPRTTADATLVEPDERLDRPKHGSIAHQPKLLGISVRTAEAQRWNAILLARLRSGRGNPARG
jgi:hypothetical protein